jgi:hypothetical protein
MKAKNQSVRSLTVLMLVILLLNISVISCKKFVEVEAPPTSVNSDIVYSTDATATAVLTGIYAKISRSLFGGINGVSLFCGLSSDELELFSGSTNNSTQYIPYYTNKLSNINTSSNDFSATIYPIVFEANSAIENLNKTKTLTSTVKTQLMGEAKFIRAFCYFYLVNLYGDIPLVLTTDYTINSSISKTATNNVYQQIIADLLDAKSLLSENYLGANVTDVVADRVRPNKWAATALLARTYLYTKQYSNCEQQSTSLILNSSLYKIVGINDVFLSNSNEAIWQLFPVISPSNTSNTQEAKLFVLPPSGPTSGGANPIYLNEQLVNSFDANTDLRLKNWVGSVNVIETPASGANPAVTKTYYYPFKYKAVAPNVPVSEYSTVLRLGEQVLIRAEARAEQDKLSEAMADLNIIRSRAGVSNVSNLTKADLLNAIQTERKLELFSEWGHRWLDLKRTNTVDIVMMNVTPKKGGTWETTDKFYPFRLIDLKNDPNLIQNPGY